MNKPILVSPTDAVPVDRPFRIVRTFLSKVRIQRPATPREDSAFEMKAEVDLGKRAETNQYQVKLRIRSVDPQNSPVNVELEAIAIFEYCGDGEPSAPLIAEFVNDRLLFVLSGLVVNTVGSLTAQMGMSPIWIPMPLAFGFTESFVSIPPTPPEEPNPKSD
jgi:preprotein translocase subunit SecB